MKNLFFCLVAMIALAGSVRADVITFFDFNDSNLTSDRGQAATLTTTFSAVTFPDGSTVNADPDGAGPLPASPAGQALGLTGQANNGNNIQFGVSTLGHDAIQISLATQRTGTGFNNNELLFSLDGGMSFTSAGFYNPPASFGLQTFDLSTFSLLNNQAGVIFRIVFNGATSGGGNNRIDNLLVSGPGAPLPPPPPGTPVPEPTTIILLGSGLAGVAGILRRRKNA